jgi:hypothetical protein
MIRKTPRFKIQLLDLAQEIAYATDRVNNEICS